VDKLPLKKDLTFDFVLLFIIDETPCLSYYPPKFMIMCWFEFIFWTLLSPKESWPP
jgi:hypothetical protein